MAAEQKLIACRLGSVVKVRLSDRDIAQALVQGTFRGMLG